MKIHATFTSPYNDKYHNSVLVGGSQEVTPEMEVAVGGTVAMVSLTYFE